MIDRERVDFSGSGSEEAKEQGVPPEYKSGNVICDANGNVWLVLSEPWSPNFPLLKLTGKDRWIQGSFDMLREPFQIIDQDVSLKDVM